MNLLTQSRVYRVIKFQPGGVHKAVVTLCGSGFFCAGVAKHEGGSAGMG